MTRKYSDQFKLSVIEDYYSSLLGVRAIAAKYGLPSKNYIGNWEIQLKRKGLLPPDATKPNKTAGRTKEEILREDDRTPREKQYEEEIQVLKAKVAYYEKLESLQPFIKKKIKIREIKYKIILSLELEYPVWLLCEIAEVNRSAFYKYKNKPLKNPDKIENIIIDIFKKSNKRAGYRTIKYILKNKYNRTVNHKKVQRIMREKGLYSIVRKKNKKAQEQLTIKEDLLCRDFTSTKPGKKFVTDITYIPTSRKMFYLCTIIDLFNKEPVAWNISDTQDRYLSINTIKQLTAKFDLEGSIIHSDRGVHYTNNDYVALLEKLKVNQSMSRKGNCWDNAPAESFFSHYKCESIYLMKNQIKDFNDVERITKEYMNYYINERPQKSLGGLSPKGYIQQKLIA